ncbi:PhoD-like phosphatase N-terminal domain-containing protein [Streptomyces sp. M19]
MTSRRSGAAARLGRRRFLTVAGAAATLAFTTNLPDAHAREIPARAVTGDPFTLGVASGDPLPEAVVLWTRLAPSPYEPGNGMPASGVVTVQWEVALDERFARLAGRGNTYAYAEFNYTVHTEVLGLQPDRVYWYRFRVGQFVSPVGRTRTTPPPGPRSTACASG